ncbi:MAG: metalloregulator ArsR/SmtB family transcription factor [Verrucomicrobiota bacterium]
MLQATQFYRCLCEPLRLRILSLLMEGPLCVCHLQTALDENQVKVSKHLAYLRRCNLVEKRKRGTWAYYELTSREHPLLRENLRMTREMEDEEAYFAHDLVRLKRLQEEGLCS